MENPTLRTALLVVCATIGIIARATDCPLTTPPPSSYPDTESSVNVAVTNWPSLGRRVKLTLSANFTPSNCVQIAFGQDSDSDGDLAPEETHLILGVDCGEPFARWEVVVGSRSPTIDVTDSTVGLGLEPTTNPTPTPSTYTFAWRQPSAVAKRCTHAKITTRGRGDSAAQIAAEITRRGVVLILR